MLCKSVQESYMLQYIELRKRLLWLEYASFVMCANHNVLYVDPVFQCSFVLRPMFYVFHCACSKFWDSFWVLAHVGVISVSPLPLGHNICVGCTTIESVLSYIQSGARANVGLHSGSDFYEGSPFRAWANMGSGLDSGLGSGSALYEPKSTFPYQYTTLSLSQCGFEFGFDRF